MDLRKPPLARLTVAERLWNKVEASPEPDGCWLFTAGAQTDSGHGMLYVKPHMRLAHRVSWTLTYGPIPDGGVIMHRCDIPRCVRPDHLVLGTVALNNADRDQKKRTVVPRGEANAGALLTDRQVRAIRSLAAAGAAPHDVANCAGVSVATVTRIVRGQAWTHVT